MVDNYYYLKTGDPDLDRILAMDVEDKEPADKARLESVLDRVGTDTSEVRDAYRYALECEIGFFSASLAL